MRCGRPGRRHVRCGCPGRRRPHRRGCRRGGEPSHRSCSGGSPRRRTGPRGGRPRRPAPGPSGPARRGSGRRRRPCRPGPSRTRPCRTRPCRAGRSPVCPGRERRMRPGRARRSADRPRRYGPPPGPEVPRRTGPGRVRPGRLSAGPERRVRPRRTRRSRTPPRPARRRASRPRWGTAGAGPPRSRCRGSRYGVRRPGRGPAAARRVPRPCRNPTCRTRGGCARGAGPSRPDRCRAARGPVRLRPPQRTRARPRARPDPHPAESGRSGLSGRAVGGAVAPRARRAGAAVRVAHLALRPVGRARVDHRAAVPVLRRGRPRPGQPYVSLPVRRRRHPLLRRRRHRHEPQGGLADPQQRARREAHRSVAHAGAVQGGAVGGAEVGHGDAGVGTDGHGAVHAGDVRVVERDIGVGRAAEPDLAAVQEVDAARVGARDHVELGGDLRRLGVRVGLARGAQAEHGPVDQRGLAQGAALGVEPLRTGVQHHLAGARSLPGERRGQRGGDRGQGRARRGGDEYVTTRGAVRRRDGRSSRSMRAQRVYDGQPDLHRRKRSLRAGARTPGRKPSPRSPTADFPHRHTNTSASTARILAPATDNAPAARRQMILIGRLCPQKCLTGALRMIECRPLEIGHVRAAATTGPGRASFLRTWSGGRHYSWVRLGPTGSGTVGPNSQQATRSA